jgi:catechol 2,3-dioxygenase
MRDLDGHRTELLLPSIQVIDIDDEPDLFLASPESTTNLWGLPPPKSWVEEATSFANVTLRRLAVEGGPMTAEGYLASRLPARVVAVLDTVGF